MSAEPYYDEELELAKAWYPVLKAQVSFYEFVKQAWHVLEPQTPFVDGWHIRAICEHLEAVTRGEIKYLIINVPPRTMKSTILNMWPAWWWISEPYKRFLCASHSFGLSTKDSIACRMVIESDWYQNNWSHIYRLEKNTEHKFTNNLMGYRQATSVGSRITGGGGDVLIGDDLNDTQEVFSDTKRDKTNRWFSVAFSGRMNDRKTGAMVIIMQRSHELDITGYILNRDKNKRCTALILPMEFESKRKCITVPLSSTDGKPWEDPRKLDGELLWPQKDGPEEVKARKHDLGNAYNIAGQLQQIPAPDAGGIISKNWFRWWKEEKPPVVTEVIQSWDTALEAGEMNDHSACTTWGLFKDVNGIDNLILLSLWRGRVEYPELRKMAQRLYNDYRDSGEVEVIADGKHTPHLVLVESKVSGHSLIHDLNRAGVMAVGFNPTMYGDKVSRVRKASLMIEGGRVWLPARPPGFLELRGFAQTMLDMCTVFPNGESRDLVDTMSQVLLRLQANGYLVYPKDAKSQGIIKPKTGFYGPTD